MLAAFDSTRKSNVESYDKEASGYFLVTEKFTPNVHGKLWLDSCILTSLSRSFAPFTISDRLQLASKPFLSSTLPLLHTHTHVLIRLSLRPSIADASSHGGGVGTGGSVSGGSVGGGGGSGSNHGSGAGGGSGSNSGSRKTKNTWSLLKLVSTNKFFFRVRLLST